MKEEESVGDVKGRRLFSHIGLYCKGIRNCTLPRGGDGVSFRAERGLVMSLKGRKQDTEKQTLSFYLQYLRKLSVIVLAA